ncbi:MAG: PAS domain S-box protein [Verrucomicrobia bacterium]|nr:PAS domain S-box protein [Verrucomicrobiota bacterium]
MDTIKPVVIGHTRETVHLRIAVTILLVLVAYRMVGDFSPQLKFFFELHTQLPVVHALTNFLFFWLLALLWIAYRRWHEALIRQRELETIFTSINPDVLLVADGEDRITMCTVVVADMFGYQPGELLGKRTDFLYTERIEAVQKRETASHPKGKGSSIGYATGRKKDGSPLALEIIVSHLMSSIGKVILLRNIAAWKDAESSLIESEHRYRSLVENAPVGVLLVDVDGRITAVNQPMLRMMGAPSASDLVGTGVIGPEPSVGLVIASAARRCMDLRVPVFLEELCTSKWRRELRLEIHLAPLQDAENRLIGVQGVFADITESHRLREEFLQAQKMEAIGHLAGGIAHDFNNLLTIITGYADLLKRSLSPGDTANAIVDEILNAGNRAGDLTRQLLAFSRRQKIQPRVLNVNQVIMGMDSMMRRLIGADIELVFLPADDLWAVCADAAQIQQCVMNLAVNARDAMTEGGKIVIRTANVTWGAT